MTLLKNIKKVPDIRFPEFGENWQSKKLEEILSISDTRNSNNKYSRNQVLSVSGDLGIVNQIEHLGRSYAGAKLDNYHVVETGDIVYTKSPLKNNPYGIIKANKKEAGIVSTLYAVYKVQPGFDFGFLDRYFELDDRTNKYLRPLVNKGAKNDMKISNKRVLIDSITIPSLLEQQKIVLFLSSVDDLIENLRLQKVSLVKYKKWIMQKLFSQKIRFKDGSGNFFPDWEEKSIGDVFERITERNAENNKNVLTISAQYGLINQEDFFNKSVASNNLLGYYLLHKGDFAYNKSYSTGYPMGAIKKLNIYDKGVVSSLYICFRTKKGNSPEFFEQYFNAGLQNREIEKIAQEGARNHGLLNISVTDFFAQLYLQVPSYSEQLKIAEFLNSIDELLSLKTDQIKLTKQWKKGLMQQMFI